MHTLTRQERLCNKEDFLRVYREGKRVRLPGLTVIFTKNSLPYSRIGISIGRRFGKAVQRNRAKRIVRELFRKNKDRLPRGYDLIFSPGRKLLEIPWKDLERCVVHALGRIDKGDSV